MNDSNNIERPAVGFGIRSAQEPKYGVNTAGRLYNRSTGLEIPDDEPVFVLRAKDTRALNALWAYYDSIVSPDHRAVVKSRVLDFEGFAKNNPERMREPTTNVSELAQANVGERQEQQA